MQQIYGNAYLVIAASVSASPSAGIFTHRSFTAYFNFDCAGQTYNISVYRRIEHGTWLSRERSDCKGMPLQKRAWAFQERVLARRLIHYTPTEIVYECNTHCRCECSGIEWPVLAHSGYEPGHSLKGAISEALSSHRISMHPGGEWQTIVTQYTARQLTVSSDCLPALSDLASQFAMEQNGAYLAGIWKSQLPDALDWVVQDARRPPAYRAPSWCWASLDGKVDFATRGGAGCLELLEVNCTTAGPSAFGEVADGYIKVKGEFGRAHYAGAPAYSADGEDFDVSSEDVKEEIWALKLNMSDWVSGTHCCSSALLGCLELGRGWG